MIRLLDHWRIAKNHNGLESYCPKLVCVYKLPPPLFTGITPIVTQQKKNLVSANLSQIQISDFLICQNQNSNWLFFLPKTKNLPWQEPAIIFETRLPGDFWTTRQVFLRAAERSTTEQVFLLRQKFLWVRIQVLLWGQ